MKLTEQLEEDKQILENNIRELIEEFVNEKGNCDIKISCQLYYEHSISEKKLVKTEVKIYLGI